ncbi:hypothetical protein R84B8_02365 [Treponema sp. R8-4-B8]
MVVGGTVYTVGNYKESNIDKACYWTNTTRTDLDSQSLADGITIKNDTIYIAGRHINNSMFRPYYWVGTKRTDLPFIDNMWISDILIVVE